jgi:succinoglycan biosynthesis transport protein ExoP
MLQLNRRTDELPRNDVAGFSAAEPSLASYLQTLRRQLPLVVAIMGACVLIGVLYLFTTAPRFTSVASLVIDTRKVQLFQQQSVLGDIPIDSATVETQIEVLKSENIGLNVVKSLRLTEDPEFVGGIPGLISTGLNSVKNLFVADAPSIQSEADLARRALGTLNANRTVRRLGLTYVMEIGYSSLDPAKASRIANAIADAYIVDQLDAKYQASRRASLWLQDRIKELRTQTSVAQKAVIDFKQLNNIVEAGGGRLVNEQQLGEVNSQLITARAATAEASARLDRINDIVKQEIPDASVADALKNETIVKLRGQYVDIASKESQWAAKYGREHLATVNLRAQMLEIKKNITEELKRIQQSYKSDVDIALKREESFKGSLASVVSESQSAGQAQVQLRELESTAQSYQAMYDNFLQRYMESVQQQSFPITEARLISPASRPAGPSSPKTTIVLGGAIAVGFMLSFLAAIGRELSDKVIRTSNQVESQLNTLCLAMIPKIQENKGAGRATRSGDEASFASEQGLLNYVIDFPISRFAEAFRSMKVALDLNSVERQHQLVALTSTLPNEGKSTVSTNFALLMAHSGASVLLIDADLRNPTLSKQIAPNASRGLVNVIANGTPVEDVIVKDPVTGLYFLPTGDTAGLHHTNEILSSRAMHDLAIKLKAQFEYVVVDLPPMAPVVDARVTSNFVDSYIFVVEWGRTKTEVVKRTLASAPEIQARLLGIVLNKTDTKIMGRYESYQSKYHYNKYYARYGYVE